MKKNILTGALLCCAIGASAQNISQEMLSRFAQENQLKGSERAIKNALAAGPVSALALKVLRKMLALHGAERAARQGHQGAEAIFRV